MARIVWTLKAAEEYKSAIEYIAAEAPVAARRLAQRIMRRVKSLRKFPGRGSFVLEDKARRYRELIEGNYRIIYGKMRIE
jgi:plasmid stabilization system protein ParE